MKLCVVLCDQREIVLMEGANVIGREPDATIQIDARGLSRGITRASWYQTATQHSRISEARTAPT